MRLQVGLTALVAVLSTFVAAVPVPTRPPLLSSSELNAWNDSLLACNTQSTHKHHKSHTLVQADVDVGFNLTLVVQRAAELSAHSWEYGSTAQALLEVYAPKHSVYGSLSFSGTSVAQVSKSNPALQYAQPLIWTNESTLEDGAGSSGDPASLGVAAVLLGAQSGGDAYAQAAERQLQSLVAATPRYANGAISTRTNELAYWADWTYMAPPFMAFQAAATNNASLLKASVEQLQLYSQALSYRDVNDVMPAAKGLWRHIHDSASQSLGLWTTGQGWALNGMLRTLATIVHWPTSSGWTTEQSTLLELIEQTLDPLVSCAQGASGCSSIDPSSGLLRGYLVGGPKGVRDTSSTWPDEVSGSAGVASALFRYLTLTQSGVSGVSKPLNGQYLSVAKNLRLAVAQHVNAQGYAQPAMNPYDWNTPGTIDQSPEAQMFTSLMGAAYRDCVLANVC